MQIFPCAMGVAHAEFLMRLVARTPDGARTLALVPGDDKSTIAFLTDGKIEPVGTTGSIVRDADDMGIWRKSG